jgi:very-short-patch-repair endonuclease
LVRFAQKTIGYIAVQIAAYDEERTRFLESKGYRVLRFWNVEVMKNRDSVADAIYRASSAPDPSPKASSR